MCAEEGRGRLRCSCSSSRPLPAPCLPPPAAPYRPPLQVTLYLRLLAEYPAAKCATGVEITVPLPRTVQRVHCETGEERGGTGAVV